MNINSLELKAKREFGVSYYTSQCSYMHKMKLFYAKKDNVKRDYLYILIVAMF